MFAFPEPLFSCPCLLLTGGAQHQVHVLCLCGAVVRHDSGFLEPLLWCVCRHHRVRLCHGRRAEKSTLRQNADCGDFRQRIGIVRRHRRHHSVDGRYAYSKHVTRTRIHVYVHAHIHTLCACTPAHGLWLAGWLAVSLSHCVYVCCVCFS